MITKAARRNGGSWDWCVAAFAFATKEGAALLDAALETSCSNWANVNKRFMVSLDFGTTSPAALTYLEAIPNSAIRIPHLSALLAASKLVPPSTFHPKVFVLGKGTRTAPTRVVAVIGSANLTGNALLRGCEAAALLEWDASHQPASDWKRLLAALGSEWKRAEKFTTTDIETYKRKRPHTNHWKAESRDKSTPVTNAIKSRLIDGGPERIAALRGHNRLWIDPGSIVSNRLKGEGNQFDAKAGTRVFFGGTAKLVVHPKSKATGASKKGLKDPVVAKIRISCGKQEKPCNVRLSGNGMEKFTLPYPEDIGVKTYTGTTLLFERLANNRYKLTVGGAAEKHKWKAASRKNKTLFQMGRGREFGVF